MKGYFLISSIVLCSCSGINQPIPPPQPNPTSIQLAYDQLLQISTDPETTWEVGDYAVRSACHSYLNAATSSDSTVGAVSNAVGIAGAGLSAINPMAGVASSLAQMFLSNYRSSGSIPFSVETAVIVENALDAYDQAVTANPPITIPQAAIDVDQQWYNCSPGGYRILLSKSIMNAQITPSPQFNANFNTSKPRIEVNPPALDEETVLPKRHRRPKSLSLTITLSPSTEPYHYNQDQLKNSLYY